MAKKPMNEQVKDYLTSLIYEGVLGMTRDEFIVAAKEIAGEQWNENGGDDDDESARDWLSADALNALAEVEGLTARYLKSVGLPETYLLKELARHHRVHKIWYKD